jgi:hypothetical protein
MQFSNFEISSSLFLQRQFNIHRRKVRKKYLFSIYRYRPVPWFEQYPCKRVLGIFAFSHSGNHSIGTFTPGRSIAEQIGKFCKMPGGNKSLTP